MHLAACKVQSLAQQRHLFSVACGDKANTSHTDTQVCQLHVKLRDQDSIYVPEDGHALQGVIACLLSGNIELSAASLPPVTAQRHVHSRSSSVSSIDEGGP